MNNFKKNNPEDEEKKIVIISDCTDIAYNELYQTLGNEFYKNSVSNVKIDPLVSVKKFSIENAAFAIRLMADIYPAGTTFLVVVNGTKSNPDRIFGQTKNGILFVGNNSGYFNWTFEELGLEYIYKNKIDRIKNNKSFGGKYVQAPTVVKLLSKIPLDEIGEEFDLNKISSYKIKNGTVIHCDNFGLMKIKSPKVTDLVEGCRIEILVNNDYKCDAVYSNKMKSMPDGTWVLFSGSSLDSMPELGKVRSKNSAEELSVTEGDVISWRAI